MKRIHSAYINIALLTVAIISLYIILAIALIPSIRIPSCLSESNASAINAILLKLSLAYVSACLFFFLTVVLKDKIRRGQQKWIVYDSMNTINDSIRTLLNHLRIDKKSDNESTTEELTSLGQDDLDTFKNDLNEIRRLIRQELLSGILWRDCEVDCLSDINSSCAFLLQFEEFGSLNDNTRVLAADAVLLLNDLSNRLTHLSNKRIHVGIENHPCKRR